MVIALLASCPGPSEVRPPSSPGAPETTQSRDNQHSLRQSLVDKLNIKFAKPQVVGPFKTTGPRTGVWEWSDNEYDRALVMRPHDYIQPTFYNQDGLCAYFHPVIVDYDLERLGFKRLDIAFPHLNVTCDIDKIVLSDTRRISLINEFKRTKMVELAVNTGDASWMETRKDNVYTGRHYTVLSMQLISNPATIYWWMIDTDHGDVTELASNDPR